MPMFTRPNDPWSRPYTLGQIAARYFLIGAVAFSVGYVQGCQHQKMRSYAAANRAALEDRLSRPENDRSMDYDISKYRR